MPDCKNTIDYFKTKQRLCKLYKGAFSCAGCPLRKTEGKEQYSCYYLEQNEPEKAVELLQKWADENMELDPCPFCGGEASLYSERDRDVLFYGVTCNDVKCGYIPALYDTKKEAAEVWNKRANLYPAGHWIKQPDGSTICSHCNKGVENDNGETVNCSKLPYCPKCGARMLEVELCAND